MLQKIMLALLYFCPYHKYLLTVNEPEIRKMYAFASLGMSLCFHLKTTCPRVDKSCTSFILFHCVFSSVSSNWLPEGMHSHIGYICLNFLHGEFSSESSKYPDHMRHSCTVYICVVFPHCVFSYESSDDAHKR